MLKNRLFHEIQISHNSTIFTIQVTLVEGGSLRRDVRLVRAAIA